MGKVKQVRRKLAQFFNWRVSVTLTDGRVLVGTLMAVDRHVNLVLCNTEEYRKYKVKGKPEGKELKRMLGFIVCRGTGVLYVQPEELGKEELVETDKQKKFKAAPKAAVPVPPKAGAPLLLPPAMLAGMPGLRMPTLPGGFPGGMPTLPGGLPGMPNPMLAKAGLPGLPGGLGGLPGFPGGLAGLTGLSGGLPGGLPGMPQLGGMNPMLAKAGGMPGFPGQHIAPRPGMPGLPGMTMPGMGMGMGMGMHGGAS